MHRPDHNDHKHLHSHHHFDPAHTSEKALVYAVTANMSLTGVQVIGGLFAGSLAVIADAMHNFGDACILILALFALKIGQRPADSTRTFGYKRAENVAALVSLTALCMISLFLIVEALGRFFYPREVEGWIMVAVTVFALAVDLWTVWLTHKGAAFSSNIHAAFLHNLFDALASIGVLCGGILIILFQWYWMDTLITILVASYAIYFALKSMSGAANLLMDAVPAGIDVANVMAAMGDITGVDDVHHLHIRRLSDQENALEAHVRVGRSVDIDTVKHNLKAMLRTKYHICHTTLEFENEHCCD